MRLSVFAGGLDAGGGGGGLRREASVEDWEVLDLLTSLVDKSLVVYEEAGGGVARYRLLETVRQYAPERLAERGEAEAVRGRHRDHFLALAEEAEAQLQPGRSRAVAGAAGGRARQPAGGAGLVPGGSGRGRGRAAAGGGPVAVLGGAGIPE